MKTKIIIPIMVSLFIVLCSCQPSATETLIVKVFSDNLREKQATIDSLQKENTNLKESLFIVESTILQKDSVINVLNKKVNRKTSTNNRQFNEKEEKKLKEELKKEIYKKFQN